ncbi:MAG: putative toxin-antitoxin system toxin component, PIN family [Gemmatimonadota bacterium]|nr:putative toxin-antitoxin system toxin component, PIN family [Gemmatimonadota bacterium]
MRVVLDTNVVVSGLLSPHGPPGQILSLAITGVLTVLWDDRIAAEYREVTARPRFAFDQRRAAAVLAALVAGGELIGAEPLPIVLPDPDDGPFLEVAAAGRADALVTGNVPHFRPVHGRHRVRVLTPAQVLDALR